VFDPSAVEKGVPPRGWVSSRKNGRPVGFWDMREYAAIILFEATHEVFAYEERPERLKLRNGPSWYFYVPTFSVSLERGPVIVELSAKGAPRSPRQELVAELARRHYASRGIRLVEIAHSVIRAKPRATDAHVLMRYLSVTPSASDAIRVSDALAKGPASVADVETASGVGHGRLLAMVRLGTLEIVGRGPVSKTSIVGRVGAGGRL
jgi:hypothetical protein